MEKHLIPRLAGLVGARLVCLDNGSDWVERHEAAIEEIVNKLPFGSGIDNGHTLDYDESSSDKIVINSAYHVMDSNGYYRRWINYRVVITASLQFGFEVAVRGAFSRHKDGNDVREYLEDLYANCFEG
jgi:hypothetical protein